MRDGWRQQLPSERYHVVMEAANGQEFLNQLSAALPLHIALIDLGMPVMDGFELMRHLAHIHPGIRLLVLSVENSDEVIACALHAGAHGYLCKSAQRAEYVLATEQLLLTGRYETEHTKEVLLKYPPGSLAEVHAGGRVYAGITPTEWKVLDVIASPDEPTNKEAGEIMEVSPRTIETHLSKVREKLNRKSTLGAVLQLFRLGWLK